MNNDNYNQKRIIDRLFEIFSTYDRIVSFILAAILGLLIFIALLRILVNFYLVFLKNLTTVTYIGFENYQTMFGMILTLLIIVEFMNTILKSIRYQHLKALLLDVILISGIAIGRKLIILDYSQTAPESVLAYSVLLVAVGISYFLLRKSGFMSHKERNVNLKVKKKNK